MKLKTIKRFSIICFLAVCMYQLYTYCNKEQHYYPKLNMYLKIHPVKEIINTDKIIFDTTYKYDSFDILWLKQKCEASSIRYIIDSDSFFYVYKKDIALDDILLIDTLRKYAKRQVSN